MGEVLQAGAGQIPSRQVSVGIGLGPTVGSETINKVCASGMRAATLADVMIRAGEHDVILAGGMETMSNAPYLLPKGRFGYGLGDGAVVDSMTYDGLTCTFDGLIMAEQNSVVAAEVGDHARGAGRLGAALARAGRRCHRRRALRRGDRAGDDPGPQGRRRSSIPTRARAAIRRSSGWPRSSPSSSPTARPRPGTRPGVNDGAAALVLASEDWAKERGIAPLAAIRGHGYVADDYAYLVRTPAAATRVALEKAGLAVSDIDLLEVNEAFCSVALNTIRLLGIDEERVNVNGGAVALGHPIGASGARLLGTLVHELRRRGGGIGVAAICSGAAQGDATVLEVFPP